MSVFPVLSKIQAGGGRYGMTDGRLWIDVADGVLTDDDLQTLRENRNALIELLTPATPTDGVPFDVDETLCQRILDAVRRYQHHPPARLVGPYGDVWELPGAAGQLAVCYEAGPHCEESSHYFINVGSAFMADTLDPQSELTLLPHGKPSNRPNRQPIDLPTISRPMRTTRETTWADDDEPNGWLTVSAGTEAQPAHQWDGDAPALRAFTEGIERNPGMVAARIAGRVRMIERTSLR